MWMDGLTHHKFCGHRRGGGGKEGERQRNRIFHLLVHFPHGYNSMEARKSVLPQGLEAEQPGLEPVILYGELVEA